MFKSRLTLWGLVATVGLLCSATIGTEVAASEQSTAAPNPVIFQATVQFGAGSGASPNTTIATVPKGKYFVGQSIAYLVSREPSGNQYAGNLTQQLAGKTGQVMLPVVTVGSLEFPGVTLVAPFYVASGEPINVTFYRTGDTSEEGIIVVTVTGYYVDGPPTS